jgi:hypothetical protein
VVAAARASNITLTDATVAAPLTEAAPGGQKEDKAERDELMRVMQIKFQSETRNFAGESQAALTVLRQLR